MDSGPGESAGPGAEIPKGFGLKQCLKEQAALGRTLCGEAGGSLTGCARRRGRRGLGWRFLKCLPLGASPKGCSTKAEQSFTGLGNSA